MVEYKPCNCPQNQYGLLGDFYSDNEEDKRCYLTGSGDADGKGWGYDSCNFSGEDYRLCPRFSEDKKQEGLQRHL